MNLSDLVRSSGYGFVVDPEPWRHDVQGNPPNPESFSALLCRDPGGRGYVACVVDSIDHAYACAHEIAGDRYGHGHTEKMLSRQAEILAGWLKQVATTSKESQ